MLKPEYIDSIYDSGLIGLYDAFEDSVIEDMARRIVKTGRMTDSAKWQSLQIQHSGMIMDDVIEKISAVSGYSQDEVRQMFNDAGAECIRSESVYVKGAGEKIIYLADSGPMKRLLDENIQLMNREIRNLTGTTAVTSQMAYINATNIAYMQVTSGAFPYQYAIANAIRDAAVEGVKIRYNSGKNAHIDTAIRRSVLTGVNQVAGKLTETYAGECGCEYYETTAHHGARPSHQDWQGQVFKINGSDGRYKNFQDATGYGSGDGLCGWNCRHSFHMFWPGISQRAYTPQLIKSYNEKKVSYNNHLMTEYEASQEARRQERSIRESKRVLAAQNAAIKAADDDALIESLKEEYKAESVKLKRKEAKLKDFCQQTNRTYESARMQVHATLDDKGRIVHFDKSASQRAVWANRKAQ